MADVVASLHSPSIACEFDVAWVGRCNKPSDNGWCIEHKNLKCSSCGARATHSCEATFSFVCGAPLCDECQHEPRGSGHVASAVAEEFYEKERRLEEARIASRTSPDQLMDEKLGVPLNLFELRKGDLTGYELKECYFLELDHGLMGFFPAVTVNGDRMVVTTSRELLVKVWRLLPRRASAMGTVIGYVNTSLGLMYPVHGSTREEQERIEPLLILGEQEFETLISGEETAFEWAPGLIGGGTLSGESFKQMIDRAIQPSWARG